MNEIRDLIIGIDFGKDYSQICYYDRKGEEPCSVSMKVGAQEFEAPTCICRRGEHKEYTIGLEAVYFAREKGGQMVDDLYGICKKEDSVQILGEHPGEKYGKSLPGHWFFEESVHADRPWRELLLLFPYPEKRDLEPEYRLVFFSPG